MAGFFFAIYFIFGHEGESYATIGNSMITTFLKFFGAPKYDEMAEISESMAIIIIIFFGIICFLIILKLFTAIVMSNYIYLRRVGQLNTEAKSRITTEQGIDLFKRFINFVTCTNPFAKEANNKDVEEEEHKELDVLAEKPKAPEKEKMTLWSICLVNWNALCNSGSSTSENLKYKQKEIKDLILKEELEAVSYTHLTLPTICSV
eukprot:TRINITY_DN20821_c0_g1_i2.p1 TRINITY_DN20821_c0_g1~~TRINITY_DN20821_c0_g1_i2.p1  ORF type:complete len:205 (-),score=53.25 TRINITY_DN20821_c0_g1_i2:34-648(-)